MFCHIVLEPIKSIKTLFPLGQFFNCVQEKSLRPCLDMTSHPTQNCLAAYKVLK